MADFACMYRWEVGDLGAMIDCLAFMGRWPRVLIWVCVKSKRVRMSCLKNHDKAARKGCSCSGQGRKPLLGVKNGNTIPG